MKNENVQRSTSNAQRSIEEEENADLSAGDFAKDERRMNSEKA
jgi:hypothetical protein